jgi:NADH-quinone oxidoreductase subunit A
VNGAPGMFVDHGWLLCIYYLGLQLSGSLSGSFSSGQSDMLFDYANVLVFALLGAGFVGVNLMIGSLLRPSNPQTRKLSTYECGEPATGSAWVNFNVRFYFIALIFIIFEVEIAFIFPVAVVFREWLLGGAGLFAFAAVTIFTGIVFLGLIYDWRKGDLEWVKK